MALPSGEVANFRNAKACLGCFDRLSTPAPLRTGLCTLEGIRSIRVLLFN